MPCRSRSWIALFGLLLGLFATSAGAQNINWTLNGTGDWNSAANWSPAVVPNGSAIDAIDTLAGIIIDFSASDVYAVNSFTDAGGFAMTGGTLTANTVAVSGAFTFDGGKINNAAISNSSSIEFGYNTNNILNGVALDGGLNLNTTLGGDGGWAHLTGGTTLGPDPTINLGVKSLLAFDNAKSDTLNGATITFEGGGTLSIEGGETLALGPSSVMTVSGSNSQGVISTGHYTSGTSTFINNGIIVSPSGTGILIGDGGSGTTLTDVTNGASGTISASGGVVDIFPTNVTNNGNIVASGGGSVYLEPTGAWSTSGSIQANGAASAVWITGTFTVAAGDSVPFSTSAGGQIYLMATMDLTGDVAGASTNFDPATNLGGTANVLFENVRINGNGVGTITHSSSMVFPGYCYDAILNGVALDSGLNLNTSATTVGVDAPGGSVQLTGGTTLGTNPTIDLGNGSLLAFNNAKSETLNGATIDFQSGASVQGAAVQIENDETLTLGSTTVVNGPPTGVRAYIGGTFWTSGSSTLINDGTITSASGGSLGVGVSGGFGGATLNSFTNGSGGTISASGSGSTITINPTSFANAGEILATGGGSISVSPTSAFTNTGTIDVESGSTISLPGGTVQSAGQLTANGTISETSGTGTSITITGGKVTGAGTIGMPLTNTSGTVSAGSPFGTLTVGNYSQGPGGTLIADIGGTTAGTGYAVLSTGTASLGGTLVVDFVDGFTPAPGEVFDVVKYTGYSGTFSSVQLIDDPDRTTVSYLPGYVQVSITGGTVPGPCSLLVLSGGLGALPLFLRRRSRR
jgi:hypothetical protein